MVSKFRFTIIIFEELWSTHIGHQGEQAKLADSLLPTPVSNAKTSDIPKEKNGIKMIKKILVLTSRTCLTSSMEILKLVKVMPFRNTLCWSQERLNFLEKTLKIKRWFYSLKVSFWMDLHQSECYFITLFGKNYFLEL